MSEQPQEACAEINENLVCTCVTSQYTDVSVPLKIRPCANVGNLIAECCGEPVLSFHQCQGANCSCGCEFTITQTLRIKIPITYGVEADIGDIASVCKRNSNNAAVCPNACYR